MRCTTCPVAVRVALTSTETVSVTKSWRPRRGPCQAVTAATVSRGQPFQQQPQFTDQPHLLVAAQPVAVAGPEPAPAVEDGEQGRRVRRPGGGQFGDDVRAQAAEGPVPGLSL